MTDAKHGSKRPEPPHERDTEADASAAGDPRRTAVEAAIAELRPIFRGDGGDIRLQSIQGRRVYVELSGACAGCALAGMTIGGLQERIVERLGESVWVVPSLTVTPPEQR
ncbi:MAG: NifU family protein [Halorhodospira sp.]